MMGIRVVSLASSLPIVLREVHGCVAPSSPKSASAALAMKTGIGAHA